MQTIFPSYLSHQNIKKGREGEREGEGGEKGRKRGRGKGRERGRGRKEEIKKLGGAV